MKKENVGITNLKQVIAKLREEGNELRLCVTGLETEVSELRQERDTLKKNESKLRNDIENNNRIYGEKRIHFAEEVEELTKTKKNLEAKVKELETRLEKMKNREVIYLGTMSNLNWLIDKLSNLKQ